MTESDATKIGIHNVRLNHLEQGQAEIKETITAIDIKIDQVLEALAERRGERQGMKMAIAAWSFISSAVVSGLAWFIQHQKGN